MLDGMHLARSISVLTTARLLCAGPWESNERYLFVCVALRYTLTSTRPFGSTVVLVSRKAIVGRLWTLMASLIK